MQLKFARNAILQVFSKSFRIRSLIGMGVFINILFFPNSATKGAVKLEAAAGLVELEAAAGLVELEAAAAASAFLDGCAKSTQ